MLYGCVTAAIWNGNTRPVRKLLAIVYGCWNNNEHFNPAHEKHLEARQAEKKSSGSAFGE
ncbi:hypothetical protein BSZ35_18210 [Salinibacter sp. 10B]|nr:hypothetical protein BSZ35_18210 [Salinibacter sp. 10B]